MLRWQSPLRWLLFPLIAALWAISGAPAKAGDLKALPWHLVDYRYRLPSVSAEGIPFDRLAVTVGLTGQAKQGDYFYLCALWGKIDAAGFYMGLQTDIHDGGQREKGAQRGRYWGPGVIFSRWGNSNSFNAKPAPGGWVVVPGPNTPYEGQTLSVRHELTWQPGTYRFELTSTRAEPPARGIWLHLSVYDLQTQARYDGGSLYFPTVGAKPHLATAPVMFAEVYAKPAAIPDLPALAASLPVRTVTLYPLEVDGQKIPPTGAPTQPAGVPGSLTLSHETSASRNSLVHIRLAPSP